MAAPTVPDTVRCPDDGTCHYDCRSSAVCWRVDNAGPLSSAGETWEQVLKVPKTPTLDWLAGFAKERLAVQDFLEWLQQKGYVLGGYRYHPRCDVHEFGDKKAECECEIQNRECFGIDPDCPDKENHVEWLWEVPIAPRLTEAKTLINEFYDIDEEAVERERRGLLTYVQSLNRAD